MPAPLVFGDVSVGPGETRDLHLKLSETFTGGSVTMPVRVIRAVEPGPVVYISAGLHGDELNGVGVVHELMLGETLKLTSGAVILLPVVNVPGFEASTRYLPDRRDLNRSFPGSPRGSLASRIASVFMEEIVSKCDYGIDLHSAALQRTNFPNVRADFANPAAKRMALAFGCGLVVDGPGPVGALRREACKAGVPTIILEAGEPCKIEPNVLQIGLRGVRNVLMHLKMLGGKTHRPPFQALIRKTLWVRAREGGLLRYHIAPGDIVEESQPLATHYSILGDQHEVLLSPSDGIVLGMTTMPAVKPGEPVVHLAIPEKPVARYKRALAKLPSHSLHLKIRHDLATNIHVTHPSPAAQEQFAKARLLRKKQKNETPSPEHHEPEKDEG